MSVAAARAVKERERELIATLRQLSARKNHARKRLNGIERREERNGPKRAREEEAEDVEQEEPPIKRTRPSVVSSVVVSSKVQKPSRAASEGNEEKLDKEIGESVEKEEEINSRPDRKLKSTIAKAPEPSRPARARGAVDDDLRKRNQRLFGNLLMGTLRSAKQASEREAKSEVVEARKMMEEELENKIVSTQQKLKEEYHERRVEDTAALKKELQQIVESVDSELKSVRSELADLRSSDQNWLLSGFAKTKKTATVLYFMPNKVDDWSRKVYDIQDRPPHPHADLVASTSSDPLADRNAEAEEVKINVDLDGAQRSVVVDAPRSPARSPSHSRSRSHSRSPSPSPRSPRSRSPSRSPYQSRSRSRSHSYSRSRSRSR